MRLGIITDIHSNLEALRTVLHRLDQMKPDQIICLGDIVGYNASPNEVIDTIRARRIPRIMGNHDAIVAGIEDASSYNEKARTALDWHIAQIRPDNRRWLAESREKMSVGEDLMAVHGAPSDRDLYMLDWMDAMEEFLALDGTGVQVCFFGHTHRASIFGEHSHVPTTIQENRCHLNPSNRYFINPGSVGQPRDRDPRAAFGFYDTATRIFEFHRAEYDIATAARKVALAGLPVSLGDRLFKGK